MQARICFLLVFCALGRHGLANSSDTIILKVGSSLYDASLVRPYKAAYNFYFEKDTIRLKFGAFEESYSISKNGNTWEGLRIIRKSFSNFSILDSGLCNAKTFQPIYHRSLQTNKTMRLDFDDNRVKGVVTIDDHDETLVNVSAAFTLFDSYFEDMIIKSLNFKEGMIVKFPVYWYEKGGATWMVAKVAGQKTLSKGMKAPVLTWEIELYHEGEKSAIYFVTKNNPRFERVEYYENGGVIALEPI